jgi:hypothetical protein
MKMYSQICLTVICIFALTFVGCTSKQASFTGEVNGVAFEVDPEFTHAKYNGSVLTIGATQMKPYLAGITFFINTNGPGTYLCNEETFAYNNHAHNLAWYNVIGDPHNRGNNSILYSTNRNNTGTVIITSFDEENKKVSGTFEFRAIRKEGGSDVVNLKGAFDNVTIEYE